MSEEAPLLEQERPANLQTLLLPTSSKYLVLPNVSVAEIVFGSEPEPVADTPDWLLGMVHWRGRAVPLVSFEHLNGEGGDIERVDRVAILNGVSGRDDLEFFGVVINGVPRQMRVIAEELITDDRYRPGAAELLRVQVSGETAAIPDIDYIEDQLAGLELGSISLAAEN